MFAIPPEILDRAWVNSWPALGDLADAYLSDDWPGFPEGITTLEPSEWRTFGERSG